MSFILVTIRLIKLLSMLTRRNLLSFQARETKTLLPVAQATTSFTDSKMRKRPPEEKNISSAAQEMTSCTVTKVSITCTEERDTIICQAAKARMNCVEELAMMSFTETKIMMIYLAAQVTTKSSRGKTTMTPMEAKATTSSKVRLVQTISLAEQATTDFMGEIALTMWQAMVTSSEEEQVTTFWFSERKLTERVPVRATRDGSTAAKAMTPSGARAKEKVRSSGLEQETTTSGARTVPL